MKFSTVFCVFLAIFAKGFADMNKTSELIGVVITFRHGARTIIQPYPTDPYRNESLWPVGFGQLTNQGKLQHLELGQWLRKRYDGFMPLLYSEKDIYVRSTDVDRTLMSAASNLAGLYPPTGKQVWDHDIPWQPIPVHTKPELDDALLAMKKPCRKYDILYEDFLNSDFIRDINKKSQELFDYLNEHTGENIQDFDTMEYLYNTLTIEKNNNFTLPEWTKSVYPDKMKGLADFSFALPCFNKDLAILKTGPFFRELLEHFFNVTDAYKSKRDYTKMRIYSGHDTTIANLLQSLEIFDYHLPPYTSTIIFELRKADNYFVNIVYKNTSVPQEMTLKDCEFDCPIEQFLSIVGPKSMSLKQWEVECKPSLLEMVESTNVWTQVVLGVAMGAVCVAIIVIVVRLVRGKGGKRDRAVYLRLPNDDEQV